MDGGAPQAYKYLSYLKTSKIKQNYPLSFFGGSKFNVYIEGDFIILGLCGRSAKIFPIGTELGTNVSTIK